MAGLLEIVVGMPVNGRLNDAVADGEIFVRFPDIYGALSLIARHLFV